MKNTFLVLSAMFLISASVKASEYVCTDGSPERIQISIKSKTLMIINDTDSARVDTAYARANPEKKSYRMKGSLRSLGDGEDGYTVYLTASKSLFRGARTGYLNKYGYGGEESSYSESYKCQLQ